MHRSSLQVPIEMAQDWFGPLVAVVILETMGATRSQNGVKDLGDYDKKPW
jgi:hypothetical protein